MPVTTSAIAAFASGGGNVGNGGSTPPAEPPVPPPEAPPEPPKDPFAAYVWAKENEVTSFGHVRKISLPGLPAGAQSLKGEWVHVTGQTRLRGNFLRQPYIDKTSRFTSDPFDQVQCYYALMSLILYLNMQGFDMKKTLGKILPLYARVNEVRDVNAWFDPRTGWLTFGTGDASRFGAWHLAEDADIVRHECGHAIFHSLYPELTSWYAGDGGAIHEGFGDAMASLYANNSVISEDFLPNTGEHYGTDRGLRDVNNDLRYNQVDREVHSLGRVYGGFWWGVRKLLEPILGDGREAADLTIAFSMSHGTNYATNRPGPKDFFDAALAGARVYLEGSKHDLDYKRAAKAMTDAAKRRGFLNKEVARRGRRERFSEEFGRLLTETPEPFAFVRESSVENSTGSRDFLQQYLVLENRHFVKMLGSGLIVFKDGSGGTRSFSASDMRRDVNVDPTIWYGRPKALSTVKQAAKDKLDESNRMLEELEEQDRHGLWAGDETERKKKITRAEALRRLDEIALEEATVHDEYRTASLVLMPEGYDNGHSEKADLYWSFRFGLTDFYVNAKTGAVATKKIAMW